MTQNFLMLCLLLITSSFLSMNHPLAMGIILLMQTLFLALLMGMINETFWLSYILFLVFMGGLLILFIYVTSLASNEMFKLNMNYVTMSSIILFLLILLIHDKMILNSLYSISINLTNENLPNLLKLFSYPTNLITILLINYLLITLIAVVKITDLFYGPLRQMFN